MEDTLKENVKFFLESQRIAGIGSYVLDVSTGLWKSSLVLDEILGIDKTYQRSVEGWEALIHPDDRPRMSEYFKNNILLGKETFDKEYRIIRPSDRTERWVLGKGRLELDSGGAVLMMHGTIQDITERKQMEMRIIEEKHFNEEIILAAGEGVIVYDAQLRYQVWNPMMEKMTGIKAAQVLGKNALELFPHLTQHGVDVFLNQALSGSRIVSRDIPYRIQDTEKAGWFQGVYAPHRDSRGNIIGVIAMIRDVTERRNIEMALWERDFQLKLAQQVAGFGVWDWNLISGKNEWSMQMYRILGLDPQKVTASFEAWQKTIHPDDVSLVESYHAQALKDGKPFIFEYRVVHPYGEVRWVSARGSVIFDEQHKPVRATGICYDITERKLSEKRLRESEERFSALFAATNEGICLHEILTDENARAVDYRILDVNPAFEKILKVSRTAAVGALASKLYGTGEPPFLEIYEKVAVTGESVTFEAYFSPMDKYFLISAFSPFRGQFATLFLDITERKQTEEILQKSEEKYRQLVQNANSVIIRWNKDGTITFFNEYAQRFFGWSADEAVGKDVNIIIPTKDSEGKDLTGLIRDITDNPERCIHNTNENICRNGRKVWMTWTNKPMFDESGKLTEILAIGTDITARKEAEEYAVKIASEKAAAMTAKEKADEVAEAYKKLHQAQILLAQTEKLSAIGTLSAGVAHELNSPLSGILGIARYYLEHKSPEDREHRDLEQIVLAGERMSKIIKGLRDFSRPSNGEIEDFSCSDMIESVLSFGQGIMVGSGVELQKEYQENLPLIRGDKNQIQQVIVNLISNAADAMDHKGFLRIATRTITVGDLCFVEMEFTDSGCGIAPKDLKKIFEPFFTTKKPGKGTGLGLSIAYSIIKQHHGEIVVESPLNGQTTGASFKVRIPAI